VCCSGTCLGGRICLHPRPHLPFRHH
jgi:hypothetical protein